MRAENPKEKESRKLNSPLLPEMIQWGVSLFATRDHNFQNFSLLPPSLHVVVCLMPTAERRGSMSLPNKGETPPHPLPHEPPPPPPPPPSEKSLLACCRLELGGSSGRRGRGGRNANPKGLINASARRLHVTLGKEITVLPCLLTTYGRHTHFTEGRRSCSSSSHFAPLPPYVALAAAARASRG